MVLSRLLERHTHCVHELVFAGTGSEAVALSYAGLITKPFLFLLSTYFKPFLSSYFSLLLLGSTAIKILF